MLCGHLSCKILHLDVLETRDQLFPAGLGVLVQPGLDVVDLTTAAFVLILNVLNCFQFYSETNDKFFGLFNGQRIKSSDDI